ncbi:class I SAM-dependent methyltransferase [Frigidibacter sp. ROC022]|uniref:class I SAM-dependent methyltransferase n=1 Tax=Frigidibacter sp. ROC022 TaxID=2971796 RepID=UPI00215ACB12|nr:SAM-dependent methyltransferase [Frigidibacter sp. ROC022]MCR8726260.1 SAM-dependent methyltransferase [Frigidibacter sp. ROC022]
MTPLAGQLLRRIAASGPLTVAEYMAECLLHPEHGYYATRDPFGVGGDFTTAPEISQMFGELLGLCLAQSWMDQGSPAPFALAELGPGRGTLMADILRATARVPGFAEAVQVWLVEASAHLRLKQQAALPDHAPHWVDKTADLPQLPLFLVANEFFDALPIRQFVRQGDCWRERVIGSTPEGTGLAWGLTEPVPVAALAHRLADTRDGDLVEVCPSAAPILREVTARIAAHGGAALVFDYGDWRSLGDTLQALRAHAPADPLDEPGEADLTAHVDFESLARAAPELGVSAMQTQGAVLQSLGIEARTAALARGLEGAALESHLAAHRRLTAPSEMGTLFKTLAFAPKDAALPPGYHGT